MMSLITKLRNTFKFKEQTILKNQIKSYSSTSDAFTWRTDKGFITKFKFSDIIKLFYEIDKSYVELHFYTKTNRLIKKKIIKNLKISNEVKIDKYFLDGVESYGLFYAYHITDDRTKENISVNNKCYTGFSKNNNIFSFVHGSTLARSYDYKKNKIISNIIQISYTKNRTYKIQKFFSLNRMNELFFANPTLYTVKLSINHTENYSLKGGNSILIPVKDNIITIKSNCSFLRPMAFSYDKTYLDVHHC